MAIAAWRQRFPLLGYFEAESVSLTARFANEDEATAAALALQSLGAEVSRCCDDDLGFELDFVQHPLATSAVAMVACGLAGVLIGAIASGFIPGVSGWVYGPVPGPLVMGGGAAAVGGMIALLICRSALPDYRPTRSQTVVRAVVPPAHLDEATAVVLARHHALELRAPRAAAARPEIAEG